MKTGIIHHPETGMISVRQYEMNQDLATGIRKCKKSIQVSGLAVVIIGLWSAIKSVMTIVLGTATLQELLEVSDAEMEEYRIIYIVFLIILLTLIFLLYLYLGISAIRYAEGKKKRSFFLIPASVWGIITFICIPLYFTSDFNVENIDATIASIMMDISMCIMLFDMVCSSVRLKKLKKEMGAG